MYLEVTTTTKEANYYEWHNSQVPCVRTNCGVDQSVRPAVITILEYLTGVTRVQYTDRNGKQLEMNVCMYV